MVNPKSEALYNVIERFVERQQIVLEALRELRPDLIMRLEKRGSPKEWTEMRLKYAGEPTTGYWGEDDEWSYRLHGIGCHLEHMKTGEILAWDVGNIRRFDIEWFVDYLTWLIESEKNDNLDTIKSEVDSITRSNVRDFVFRHLIDLEDSGLVKSGVSNRYILI